MSIGKLFVKVFKEEIFPPIGLRSETDSALDSLEFDDEDGLCGTRGEPPKRPEDMSISEQMAIVKSWLDEKLENIELNWEAKDKPLMALRHARLGPAHTVFDIDYSSSMRTSTDRLAVRSQGSFNTIKANTCVYGGRWMYELHLHAKGVMQLGWCSNKCVFNENSGVGDTILSYGYDGSKQQFWHVSTTKYGDKWQIGDIIGVTIDVEREKIEYYRNGKSMGAAITQLETGPSIVFYPAVSLGFNQGVQANFGNFPFKYPIEGFMPLQAKPNAKLERADLLLGYMINLATILARQACCKEKKPKDYRNSTKRIVYVAFCSLLTDRLAKVLFDPYVIHDKLLMCVNNLCFPSTTSDTAIGIDVGCPDSVLGVLLSTLWNFLEIDEMKYILKKLCNALLTKYTHTHKALDYEEQRNAIFVLTCLCNHTTTRRSFLEHKFFRKHCLALFLYMPPPSYSYMKELVPNNQAWTEGIGGNKVKYLAIVDKVTKSTETLYVLHKALLLILLNNNDGDAKHPSSRKIFLIKLRRYVMDLSLDQRTFFLMQSSLQYPIESQVSLCFLCLLLDATRTLFQKELQNVPPKVEIKYFVDGSFEYQHFDRLGGVVTHLRKVHRNEIQHFLGPERAQALIDEERTVVRIAELDPSLFIGTGQLPPLMRNTGTGPSGPSGPSGPASATFTQFFNTRANLPVEATSGNATPEASINELLDISVMFYYSVGHKYVVKVVETRDEIAVLNEVIHETQHYREAILSKFKAIEQHAGVCLNDPVCSVFLDLKEKYGQRENVFAKRSIELSRKQVWLRAVAISKHRRELIIWLMERTLATLNASSAAGPLFTFVPEVYINVVPILLDCVMDFSHHDLYIQFDIGDAECGINTAAEFLGMHSADARIVIAACKDSLLQGLGTLTCHKSGIRALERSTKRSQLTLIKSLLRPYENRAWGQSNWLLLRFWMGDGFAYRDARQPSVWQGGNTPTTLGLCRSRARNETHTGLLHHVAPSNPSKVFQNLIATKLKEDEPFATNFLNSVLGQLNWAFSEFILLLQEIQNTAHRQENTVFEPKQLKICSMCFELTVSLMRCLEMIIYIAPDIFQDPSRPNSDLILTRVCQLISQVLSRVTVPPGCFQFVVDMCSADLNSVTHFPIITAALGILLALMRAEMEQSKNPVKITRVTRALLTDPSFQFASIEFALGEVKTPILQQSEIPRGNFDPSTRAHIDPLTNDVRVPMPSTSTKRIRADPPIIKFSLLDFPTHITPKEIDEVRRMVELLRVAQSMLSDITLPSEDSLCPICCAKPISVTFYPCKHQSCKNCIMQHLMNSKVCFYCKTPIEKIETAEGAVIYYNTDMPAAPSGYEQM